MGKSYFLFNDVDKEDCKGVSTFFPYKMELLDVGMIVFGLCLKTKLLSYTGLEVVIE